MLDERTDVDDDDQLRAVRSLAPAAVPHRIVRHQEGLPTLTSGKADVRRLTDC